MTQNDRPASAAEIPERIGKYEITGQLGRGAMGVVYHAHDPFLERDVALKVMLPQIADDPEQKHRFEREARAVAKMTHPNVVTIFDLGYHTDGSPYIAMELLKGRDLQQALREGDSLPLERKVSIILQVLDGLGHAHAAGIVHRDIKPANTFLNQDGTVKIMDFGVARMTAASMTATGIVVGTANYMAPEQVDGAKVDGRADLFSAGCMLYELLLGRRPFESETLLKTLWRIVHAEPDYGGVPGEAGGLLPVVRRALAKRSDERFQTAAEFSASLRAAPTLATPAPEKPAAGAPAAFARPREAGATLELERAREASRRAEAAALPLLADPTALFRLMREIYVGAKSGHLHFSHGQERRSLRFLRGSIVQGQSDVDGQHLGDTLVRYGMLTQAELDRATGIVLRERRLLGAVLAELKLVSPERLAEAVGLHIREILSEVAGRGDGRHSFEEQAHEGSQEVRGGPAIAVGEMILETARRIQAPEVVRRVLGDVDRLLSLSTQPLLRSQKLTLTPTDGFLLSRIDGTLTAREVCGLIPLPSEDVERSLFGLLCCGTLEYVEPHGTRPARGPARPNAEAQAAEAERRREALRAAEERAAVAVRAAEARRRAEQRRGQILAVHARLGQQDDFELLGIARGCSAAQVEEAYRGLLELCGPASAPPEELREERKAIEARLAAAYQTLRDPKRRAQYEKALDARQLRSQIQPPAPPPPRQAASLYAEGPLDAESVTLALREAQRLLREDKAWDAIQLLEPLVSRMEGHSRFRVQVMLARAYLRNPKWAKRAEELLHRVVREAPEHVEAYVVLGNIYRAAKLKTRATAMYRRALSLHPGHHEALDGLAALDSGSA